jgi:hypothetical protein
MNLSRTVTVNRHKYSSPSILRYVFYTDISYSMLRTVIMVTFRHLFLDNTCPFSYLHNNCYFVLSCNPNFFFRIGEYLHNCTLFLASNTQSINTHARWMKYTTHTWLEALSQRMVLGIIIPRTWKERWAYYDTIYDFASIL